MPGRLGHTGPCAARLTRIARLCWPATLSFFLLVAIASPARAIPNFQPRETQRGGGPALWVVSDGDTTIYLFGTFHALDSDLGWFTRSVRSAFDLSEELILETVVPTDPAELHAALARHRLAPEPVAGAPVVEAEQANDFVASAGKAVASSKNAGLSVWQGADSVLKRAAHVSGKPISGLETFDFQLGMLSAIPNSQTVIAAPPDSLDPVARIRAMRLAWRKGDSSRVAALVGSIANQSPEAYRLLYADRNARWAKWIAQRMERPGTIFVAVGSGHLVGSDSVQARLAEFGLNATRID